jgi:hypothetical protein
MNAFSMIGPSLALYENARYGSKTFLFFKGHNNEHIWEGEHTTGSGWEGRGRVNDEKDPASWAFTNVEPVSFTYTLPAITRGLAPRSEQTHTYLIFKGHNNSYVWYTRREIRRPYGGGVSLENWGSPLYIPGTVAQYAPGAAMHAWGGDYDPVLTIAYTDHSNRIRLKRASESTRPLRHRTPFEWRDIPAISEDYKSGSGVTVISFKEKLYVFFRGNISGYDDSTWHRPIPDPQLYYAVSHSNNPNDPDWEVHRVPNAYSMLTLTATLHTFYREEESLIIAFKGHNNNYIWLRKFDGERWQNLGWIDGVCTSHRPAILSSGWYTFTLAFIPEWKSGRGVDPNIAVGTLNITSGHEGDYADHGWNRTQGTDACFC